VQRCLSPVYAKVFAASSRSFVVGEKGAAKTTKIFAGRDEAAKGVAKFFAVASPLRKNGFGSPSALPRKATPECCCCYRLRFRRCGARILRPIIESRCTTGGDEVAFRRSSSSAKWMLSWWRAPML